VPELPEVETVRRGLAERVLGRRIEHVDVGRWRAVRRTGPERVIGGLTGRSIVAAERRGKYIVCPLDSGESLMVHLRMSGQLLVDPIDTPRPPHSHVNLRLASVDGRRPAEELRFVDPRTFGEVVVFAPHEAEVLVPELGRLGPDPLVDTISLTELRRRLASTRRGAKALLLDQAVIAGIGNIYSDEILHRAGIHPMRPANRIGRAPAERLLRAVDEVLRAAVVAGGSTLRDAQYVDLEGRTGTFQASHRVYGRAGEICLTCGRGRIKTATVAGRTGHWCAVCQR
jgi:formamidopyrimidine-DNA glycosylase